jgi:hypothetical protein
MLAHSGPSRFDAAFSMIVQVPVLVVDHHIGGGGHDLVRALRHGLLGKPWIGVGAEGRCCRASCMLWLYLLAASSEG